MRCWTDDANYHDNSGSGDRTQSTIKINEFQLCKKSQIQDQKIEMEMVIQTKIEDYEILDNLDALFFSVEIGELHERDKFKWVERNTFEGPLRKK